MAQLTIHHLEESRSHRILWLLEELELEHEVVRYARVAGRAPPELRRVHPLGRSPVLIHGDKVIAESGALVEYVLDAFGEGRMRPARDSEEFERYRFYLHFAEGSMMAPLLLKLVMGRLAGSVPLLGKIIAGKVDAAYTDPEIRGHLELVESALEGHDWLAGELSGADVLMSFPLQAALSRAGIEGGFPNIRGYVARIEARPAYARAVERGGPNVAPS